MSVKVVILGAGGLVGARMIENLVNRSTFGVGSSDGPLPLAKIVLFDMRDISADLTAEQRADPRVSCVAGDLTDRATLDTIFAPEGCTRVTVIQLAAVLSGYAESDFELGMKVNLYGAIGVMDALRAVGEELGTPCIYLFTSTDYVTAYNQTNKENPTNEESFRLSPVSYASRKLALNCCCATIPARASLMAGWAGFLLCSGVLVGATRFHGVIPASSHRLWRAKTSSALALCQWTVHFHAPMCATM